ncbi:MAG: RnfABCDGE type electron transport complex subunit C [Deltaproteobacteria bacterium]|nr:RnfABCDGE type electron transport complex subunit C [Deltaproteobacteria bacterium]
MLEQPLDVVTGAVLIGKIVGASRIVIGVEDNKPDAIAALSAMVPSEIAVSVCASRYPQGSERQLVEALTGRTVPTGKLPLHVGVVVQNVATAVACSDAIRYRRPLIDRTITVAGSGIARPANLRVPIGTSVKDVIAACGGLHPRAAKVIAGGPMMGRALGRLDVPIIKSTGGLIVLRADEIRRATYGPCISCGRCLEACPLGLEPNAISIYTEAGRALETEPFGTRECFECGCCAFVCPSQRPLVQFIQTAKAAFSTGSQAGLAVRPGVAS